MRKILAIGGAVVKTAFGELKSVIRTGDVEMLIHNGGSIFHDFQVGDDKERNALGKRHSYPLDEIIADPSVLVSVSHRVWKWLRSPSNLSLAQRSSATKLCGELGIPVLMFTAPYADFWYAMRPRGMPDAAEMFAGFEEECWKVLTKRFSEGPFHYVCMGSAVIHPEIFIKAVTMTRPEEFKADVVDMNRFAYRPTTRVSRYGDLYVAQHQVFLEAWYKAGYWRIAKGK